MILTILIIILQTADESETTSPEYSIPGIEIWFWVGVTLIIFIIVLIIKQMLITSKIAHGKRV